jgi:hypothetical protein
MIVGHTLVMAPPLGEGEGEPPPPVQKGDRSGLSVSVGQYPPSLSCARPCAMCESTNDNVFVTTDQGTKWRVVFCLS